MDALGELVGPSVAVRRTPAARWKGDAFDLSYIQLARPAAMRRSSSSILSASATAACLLACASALWGHGGGEKSKSKSQAKGESAPCARAESIRKIVLSTMLLPSRSAQKIARELARHTRQIRYPTTARVEGSNWHRHGCPLRQFDCPNPSVRSQPITSASRPLRPHPVSATFLESGQREHFLSICCSSATVREQVRIKAEIGEL